MIALIKYAIGEIKLLFLDIGHVKCSFIAFETIEKVTCLSNGTFITIYLN